MDMTVRNKNNYDKYCTLSSRLVVACCLFLPLSSTRPHLNSDVGLEKGEY